MKADATYSPLCTLNHVASDVWVVDGAIIWFGQVWPKRPFPTRMTVVPGQQLAHPLADTAPESLAREVVALGKHLDHRPHPLHSGGYRTGAY